MDWLKKLFGKMKTQPLKQEVPRDSAGAPDPKPAYLTQTVVFGMHRYRRAGEDSSVYFVDEARGIRKMLVDSGGRFQAFPGIVKENFWVKKVTPNAMKPQIRFRTSFEKRPDKWLLLWEIQPDGRYWEDEDGFGAENEEEVLLYTYVDMDGNYTGPFRVYSVGMETYLHEE